MTKKFFTDESLATFVNETKTYADNAVAELSSIVVYASDSNENIIAETDGIHASEVSYVNTASGLSSTNVQSAIDELSEETSQLSSEIVDLPNNEILIDKVAEVVKTEVPLVKVAEQPTFVDSIDKMTDTSKVYVLTSDFMYYVYMTKSNNFIKTLAAEDYGIGNMSVNGLPQSGTQRIYTTELLPLSTGSLTSISISSPYDFIVYFYNTDSPTETNVNTISSNLTGKTTWNVQGVNDVRNVSCTTGTMDGATYFRVAFRDHNSNTNIGTIENMLQKVTITYKTQGEITEWTNTGHSYNQPVSYEDRIVALENTLEVLENGTY